MTRGIDHQALLARYIQHVGNTQGSFLVPGLDDPCPEILPFTREELVELNRIIDSLPATRPS